MGLGARRGSDKYRAAPSGQKSAPLPPPPPRRPRAQSAERPACAQSSQRNPSGLPAAVSARAAHRSEVAAGHAGWAAGARDNGRTAGGQRGDGYPKRQSPSLLPTCRACWLEGMDRWVWGGRSRVPGRRGFEKLWGMIIFPKAYKISFRLFIPRLNRP